MRYALAIDEGTTGVTCLMIGENGRVAGRGYREIAQHFPKPGWVEHDAVEILAKTVEAAREAVAAAGATPETIGITNQREGARDGNARASRHRLAGPAYG